MRKDLFHMSEKKSIHPIIPIIIIPTAGFILLNLSFLLAAGIRVGIHLLINTSIDNPQDGFLSYHI